MGAYDVYVLCDECFEVHRVAAGITLEDGPEHKQSVEEAYAGKLLPPEIEALIKDDFQCPNTGKPVMEKDVGRFFLVPVIFI